MRNCSILSLAIPAIAASTLMAGCASNRPDVDCTPPRGHWLKPSDGVGAFRVANIVTLESDGRIFWNREPISVGETRRLAKLAESLEPQPQIILHLKPNTDCRLIEEIRTALDESPLCKTHKLCGEGYGWRTLSDVPPFDTFGEPIDNR